MANKLFSKLTRSSIVVASAAYLLLTPAQAAKLYKWVDAEGQTHYSDKIPAEKVKQEHKILNEQGMSTKEVNRAKTDEEKMAEQVEASLEDEERRKKAQKLARQRLRDKILTDTYTTERDLLIDREDKISAIESLIRLTELNNSQLRKLIDELSARIKRNKDAGRDVPDNLIKDLENKQAQLKTNEDYIVAQQEKMKSQIKRFDTDLVRFRELKGIAPETADNPEVDKALEKEVKTKAEPPQQETASEEDAKAESQPQEATLPTPPTAENNVDS